MKIPTNFNGYRLFSALGIFILGLEFLAIILTLLRIFYWPILAVYFLVGIILLAALFFHNWKKINRWQILAASLLSLLAISFFSLHAEPSIFSGRDQGSFSEAAVRLSQNHQLEFETPTSKEFFKIYGPGIALNFPGFSYTQAGALITHFSLGYIAWLAVFYALFGLSGFSVANGVLLFLFLLSFFALVKVHTNLKSAWLGLALAISSFIFSWFFKLTLSENLALGFIWFSILEFSLFLKYRDQLFLLSALSAFLLLAFTRLEAWALLAMFGIVLFLFQKKEKNLFSKIEKRKVFWLLGVFLATYIVALKVNSQFYLSSAKGLLHSFSSGENSLGAISALTYLSKVFYYYNLLIFIIIGALGIFYFFYKKKYFFLVPFLVLLPLLVYLIHPGISLDHPWMLRRFSFAIIPLGIFYTTLIADRLFSKQIYFSILATLLVVANLTFSLPYATFSENAGLLNQTRALGNNFSATDLVLVDQLASGDGWSMIGSPLNFLYGKQAVYFFNQNDLGKIDLKKFTNAYFIIPNESLASYEKFGILEKLIPQKDYQLERKYLIVPDLSKDSGFFQELPIETQITTTGKIYLLNQ
ncbi:MAG: hypothetical protein NTY33_00575 [Candidatus Moranbacteria bacterium]|nr:hypothetical protein [Candidatus Moranbacteria bacterium]